MKCAECGGELVFTSTALTEEIRGESYEVDGISRYECQSCHEYVIDAAEERRLSAELWRRYCQKHGLLSPGEIVSLREGMGLTQADFGKLIEANAQTVCRWENGKVYPDARANRLMVLLRDSAEARTRLFEIAEIHVPANAGFVVVPSTPITPAMLGSKPLHFNQEVVSVNNIPSYVPGRSIRVAV